LSIHADGITDFGVADQGDPRDGKRTPVGLVLAHLAKDNVEAAAWLSEKLGIAIARDKHVAKLNESYALVIVGDKTAVMKTTAKGVQLLTVGAFATWLSNRFVEVGNKTMPLARHWLGHHERRQYEGLVFAPKRAVPGYY